MSIPRMYRTVLYCMLHPLLARVGCLIRKLIDISNRGLSLKLARLKISRKIRVDDDNIARKCDRIPNISLSPVALKISN